jgi:hypothetical protein
MRHPSRLALPVLLFAITACWIVRKVDVEAVQQPLAEYRTPTDSVRSPVKAHLIDGSTVVYTRGVAVREGGLRGAGMRYDLTLGNPTSVSLIPLDSVVGLEAFRTRVDDGKTILFSTLTSVVVPAAAIAIACAIDPKCFGSCPTYYSDSSGTAVLEAEGFSYSIAPLFEARDLDRLRTGAGADGTVRLEVRNEAFETHYLNQLEVIELRHARDELALPDQWNRPLVIGRLETPVRVRDRSGRNVRREVTEADGRAFRTAPHRLAAAAPGDLEDWIEITSPVPVGADSVALLFRMRNSLLNTVLLYDIMLGSQGPAALDWVGEELERIGPAVAVGQWYARRMGMGISVRGDDGAYRDVARVRDTGPVAWKDVAVVVPAPERDSLRIRISFAADNWRIDRIALAASVRRPEMVRHPLTAVLDAEERADSTALAGLTDPDSHYLQTLPGQRFTAVFGVGPAPVDSARTFLLVSQGYYIEWQRRAWLTGEQRAGGGFQPSEASLYAAISRWRDTQGALERQFMATKVPVR